MENLLKATMLFLREKAPCQKPEYGNSRSSLPFAHLLLSLTDSDDDEEEKQEKDHDDYAIDSITDLVAIVSNCRFARASLTRHC